MTDGRDKGEAESRHAATVKNIRASLGRTQKELGVALGISEKAIQSYEEGWRRVPTRVLIQLLVLLAIQRKRTLDDVPCWNIRDCPREMREQCPSYTMSDGQFCWFVAGGTCRPEGPAVARDVLPCMRCPVVRRLLAGVVS